MVYWKHFWWGLAIGVVLGAWIGFSVFNNHSASLGLTAGVALYFALCSGRWGDEFWATWFDNWS